MKIADTEVSIDDALKKVINYGDHYFKTLEIFDGLGERGTVDEHPNKITIADIGRLVVINAGLKANDVPLLLDVDAGKFLEAIPVDARLEDCQDPDPIWESASLLYEAFQAEKLANIGPAKRSKLLHGKRPGLFFINDSRTRSAYKKAAKRIAAEFSDGSLGYWEAARRDILQADFKALMSRVAEVRVEALPGKPSLESLSRVRVLDIVCWSR